MTAEEKKQQEAQAQAAPQQTAPVAPTARDNFMSGFGKRHSDIDQSDEDAVYGQMGKDYEELDNLRSDRDSFNSLMKDQDGLNAGLMNGMLTGKNIDGSKFSVIQYLIGDHPDLAKAALEGDGESLDQLIEARNQEIADAAEKANQEAADAQQLDEKVKAEDAALAAAVKKAKYNTDQVKDLVDWIYNPEAGLLTRAMTHELTEKDFAQIIKIIDYEGDVAKAEDSGYKRGKSERIAMNREMRSGNNRPTNLGGGGSASTRQNQDPTMAALDRMSQL